MGLHCEPVHQTSKEEEEFLLCQGLTKTKPFANSKRLEMVSGQVPVDSKQKLMLSNG